MLILKRVAQVTAIAVPLLMLNGCFPTEVDKGASDSPSSPDLTIVANDGPQDLPSDINSSANTSDAGLDSMFNLLVTRAEAFENIGPTEEFYALDFTSLRQGFGAAVNKTPDNIKANVGFIVASVLSFNADKSLQKVVDSMDCYINDMEAYYSEQSTVESTNSSFLTKKAALKKSASLKTGFISKTFASRGIISAGQALFAETPKILMAQTSRPSFPRFLTVSYIQNMLETGVIPRLNEVIASTQRLRALSQMSLQITVKGEPTEIDVGDIFLLEGMTRAARAGFAMMCIYDYDIYNTNGSNDMRWIDSYVDGIYNYDYSQTITYSLSGDTLYRKYYYDMTGMMSSYYDVYRYNLNRSGFLSIRKNFHQAVYNDLKEIPVLVKAGLTAIRAEQDNQDDDLIPNTGIFDISEEMGNFCQDMLDAGFSNELASKFQTPEALMDFISKILSNPYTFDETIDGKHVAITIDLSKYFTNPAASLKEYWPKYKIPTGDDQYATYTYNNSTSSVTSTKTLYTYNYDYDAMQVDIPASKIDRIDSSSSSSGTKIYYFKNPYKYESSVSTTRIPVVMQLIDDNGNPINYYDLLYSSIYSEMAPQTLSALFPYFNDYTFRGIFPDMKTRQNWVDFFSVFVE